MGTADEDAARAGRQAAERLGALLRDLYVQAGTNRAVGFHVPTVDIDPDVDDPTNMWRFDDGRLRTRGDDGALHEFVPIGSMPYRIRTVSSNPAAGSGVDFWVDGPTGELRVRAANGAILRYQPVTASSSSAGGGNQTGSSSTSKAKPARATPRRYRKVYDATWGRTLCPQHGPETGANLRFGYYSGTHGQRRVMIGLPDATIRTDLAGATIRRVQLHLRITDSFDYAGINVTFGAHNRHDPPGSYSAVRRSVWTGRWPHAGDGAYWRTVPTWFASALKNNQAKGLTVDQDSNARARYGELDWSSLRLAIDYTR